MQVSIKPSYDSYNTDCTVDLVLEDNEHREGKVTLRLSDEDREVEVSASQLLRAIIALCPNYGEEL